MRLIKTHTKMKKTGQILLTTSVFMILFFLVAPRLWFRAHGETDYMEELSIVRFEEKIKAQNFILKDLSGNEVSLADYHGKVILINFWATWCLPCRIEMPSMEKLYAKFKNDGFTILAIDMQEDADSVRAFKEQYQLNFPILLDSDGSVGQFYGVISIPTTYLVDREGYIIGGAIGARDWADESAFMLIDQLLKASPNS
jgi:peroxiredoxin